jgi:hypothetical protein
LWKDRDARRPRPYQPRYRRDCRGELIQVDGSKHWWFKDRGVQCTLLVYIDDATSELMQLKMVESGSAAEVMSLVTVVQFCTATSVRVSTAFRVDFPGVNSCRSKRQDSFPT